MIVVFTDLDGTLLDAETYSADAAKPALKRLKELSIPLIFCTSKTRAEVEVWRNALQNRDPFVVENGGALFIPNRYFPHPVASSTHRNSYTVIELGTRYQELVKALGLSASQAGCRVRGFSDMSTAEVADCCGMSPEQAALAKQREYDEPFEILDGNSENLLRAIAAAGKQWTRGGRFYHITGKNDKAHAVGLVAHHYRRQYRDVVTIGLGDGLNDVGFLNAVDVPVLIPSLQIDSLMEAVPNGRVAGQPGPAGWNSAVLRLLEEYSMHLPKPDNPPGS